MCVATLSSSASFAIRHSNSQGCPIHVIGVVSKAEGLLERGAQTYTAMMNGQFSAQGSVTPTPMDEIRSTEVPGILRESSLVARKMNTDIPNILPHERVFPIQIGQELFRLSGASISSDGMCTMRSPIVFMLGRDEGKTS